jgi:integrase
MPRFKKDKLFEYKGWWIERIANSSNYYGARYDHASGTVRRQSLGTDDLEKAKDALIQLAQVAGPKTGASFLAAVLKAYFQDVTDAKPSADTARYAGHHILSFWGDEAQISELTDRRQKEFWRWAHDQGHSPAYIARNLSVLSAAVRHGVKDQPPKIITSDRMIAEKLGVPEPQPREWIPTDDELARYLDTLSHESSEHVFRYCLLALNTLARPSAVLDLAPPQIDNRFGLVNLNPEGRRQTKKFRPIVRLTETMAPWLPLWSMDETPWMKHLTSSSGMPLSPPSEIPLNDIGRRSIFLCSIRIPCATRWRPSLRLCAYPRTASNECWVIRLRTCGPQSGTSRTIPVIWPTPRKLLRSIWWA